MYNQPRRIPTLLALVLVAALSIGGLFAYDQASTLLGRAGNPAVPTPENVRITNKTDTSLVLSWTTSDAIGASVRYTSLEGEKIAYDIRDTDSFPKPYKIHYVPLSSIDLSQSSSIEILHGTTPYIVQDIGLGPALDSPPQILPLYGSIQSENSEPVQAVLYATIDNDVLYSTFLLDTNEWIVSLASIRTSDSQMYLCNMQNACSDSTPVTYTIQSEDETFTVSSTIGESRPLVLSNEEVSTPEIQGIQDSTSSRVETSPSPRVTTAPITPKNNTYTVDIIQPKNDAQIRFAQPLFRGTGIAGNSVDIRVTPNQISDTMTVRPDGTWLWTPPSQLQPGEYTFTITSLSASKKHVTKSRSFSIAKSGQQVLALGTPSGSLSPTSVPTTFTTPSSIPTSTPIIPTPTPLPDIPQASSYTPSLMLLFGGLALVFLGIVFVK